MSLYRNRDSGIPETEKRQKNQAVNLAHLIYFRNNLTMTVVDIHVCHDPITLSALLDERETS